MSRLLLWLLLSQAAHAHGKPVQPIHWGVQVEVNLSVQAEFPPNATSQVFCQRAQ